MSSKGKYLAATATALAIAVVAVLATTSGSGSGRTTTSASIDTGPVHSTYGHPPEGVTVANPSPVQTLTASTAKPDLYALEGYVVHVNLPSGSGDIQVEGPSVPAWVEEDTQAGTLKLTTPVPAVFTITVSHVKGSIPLNANDWGVQLATDQARTIRATGVGQNLNATTGQTKTLKVKLKLPDGDGVIQWTPGNHRLIAAWSWQLEYD